MMEVLAEALSRMIASYLGINPVHLSKIRR